MKIKIEKVESRTTKDGSKEFYIVFFDGKSGLSWDAGFKTMVGQEVEADVEEKEENGQKRISVKLPKSKSGFGGFSKGKSEKELGMEFRAKALEFAIESAKLANISADKATSVNMINVAKTYHKYIETGE